MIWKIQPSLEGLNASSQRTVVDHLGIVFTEVGDDYLVAEMPVDHRSVQPMRAPVRLGRRVQVWSVDISNEEGKLVCTGRITCQVMNG